MMEQIFSLVFQAIIILAVAWLVWCFVTDGRPYLKNHDELPR